MGLQEVAYFFTMAGAVITLLLGVSKHKVLFIQTSGILLIMLAVIVILGYIINEPKVYTFPSYGTSMALPTGICFGIVGGCLYVLGSEIKNK